MFNFSDPTMDLRSKEIKRAALNEILDYITNYRHIITEPIYPEIIKLVRNAVLPSVSYLFYLPSVSFSCSDARQCIPYSSSIG